MDCPHCERELDYIDYYGHYLGNDRWNKVGDIFKCLNENCESEIFNHFFYTDKKDNLHEGYPC